MPLTTSETLRVSNSYPYPGTQATFLPGTNMSERPDLAPFVAFNAPTSQNACNSGLNAVVVNDDTFCYSKISAPDVNECVLGNLSLGEKSVADCLVAVGAAKVDATLSGWGGALPTK